MKIMGEISSPRRFRRPNSRSYQLLLTPLVTLFLGSTATSRLEISKRHDWMSQALLMTLSSLISGW